MPNTLVHIALQGPITGKFSSAFFAWMLIGCVLPDLPWIGMHLIQPLDLFNPYKLRLYFTAQASLFFCVILAGAIALLMRRSREVFFIIALNTLFHLLLDTLQIKWGNGVNLFAPFDWHLFSLSLIWPENLMTVIVSIFGILYFFFVWKKATLSVKSEYELELPKGKKLFFALFLTLFYLVGPFLFFPTMERANTYNLTTMLQKESRTGKTISFDRAHYDNKSNEIKIYSGEYIHITGERPKESGRVSFVGIFTSPDTVRANRYHLHKDKRDLASLTGLILTCAFLFNSLLLPVLRQKFHPNSQLRSNK